ncbi:hypothetical protein TNCV_4605131 [Trichonephila clavipes]|nr:hypothetical protein TNCV_4605131 [Trichonephila clavipes]
MQDSKCSREFQTWWAEKYGMINKGDKTVCVLCSGTVAWERVTLFGGVRETHSPNSVSCKQQEQGRCTSRTLDSQTPGSRTAVHVLMGEKEKNVWSVVILLKQRNSSSVL